MTFVSARMGWALGGVPCATGRCPALLATTDGGRTWQPLSVPAALEVVPPDAHTTGVRFATTRDGWVFSGKIWSTHDGGRHWAVSPLADVGGDMPVVALEASNGLAHVAVIDGSGTIRVETSPVSRESWQVSPASVSMGAGPVPMTQIVLHASEGWLLQVDRTVIGGLRLRAGRWEQWRPPCVDGGGGVALAASTDTDLAAVCEEGVWFGPRSGHFTYVSRDGGTSFRQVAAAAPEAMAALASPTPNTLVGAQSGALWASFDGGSHWSKVLADDSGLAWTWVGFTTPDQGVAIAAGPNGGLGPSAMTRDGGHHWNLLRFST